MVRFAPHSLPPYLVLVSTLIGFCKSWILQALTCPYRLQHHQIKTWKFLQELRDLNRESIAKTGKGHGELGKKNNHKSEK